MGRWIGRGGARQRGKQYKKRKKRIKAGENIWWKPKGIKINNKENGKRKRENKMTERVKEIKG